MRIVVNHLTRMLSGYICVAGVDVETKRHVRPIGKTNLRPKLLARNGGPFDIGAVVDLGPVTSKAQAPELEDWLFDPAKAVCVKLLERERFWRMLEQMAQPKLAMLFGEALKMIGPLSCGVGVGTGTASLGCLVPRTPPKLYLRNRDGRPPQVRMRLGDGAFDVDVSVTDLRLYGEDCMTPNPGLVKTIVEFLSGGGNVILSVGLTRPYAPRPDRAPKHWLQVNNIHLGDA